MEKHEILFKLTCFTQCVESLPLPASQFGPKKRPLRSHPTQPNPTHVCFLLTFLGGASLKNASNLPTHNPSPLTPLSSKKHNTPSLNHPHSINFLRGGRKRVLLLWDIKLQLAPCYCAVVCGPWRGGVIFCEILFRFVLEHVGRLEEEEEEETRTYNWNK